MVRLDILEQVRIDLDDVISAPFGFQRRLPYRPNDCLTTMSASKKERKHGQQRPTTGSTNCKGISHLTGKNFCICHGCSYVLNLFLKGPAWWRSVPAMTTSFFCGAKLVNFWLTYVRLLKYCQHAAGYQECNNRSAPSLWMPRRWKTSSYLLVLEPDLLSRQSNSRSLSPIDRKWRYMRRLEAWKSLSLGAQYRQAHLKKKPGQTQITSALSGRIGPFHGPFIAHLPWSTGKRCPKPQATSLACRIWSQKAYWLVSRYLR